MQKKLIALAVAGLAAAPAFAQSNVTIYGTVDATFDMIGTSGARSNGGNVGSFSGKNRINSNSSLLGFKGVEDLGNGLKAIWQIESSINLETGAGNLGGRDTFAGLTGGFGTVVAGQLTGPTRALGAKLDANAGATGIGANTALLGKLGNLVFSDATLGTAQNTVTGGTALNSATNQQIGPFDTRWKNAIAYVTPTFAGFTGTFAYVANENKSANDPQTSATQQAFKGYDLGLAYENGPIYTAVTYNAANFGVSDNGLTPNAVRLQQAADLRAAFLWAFTQQTRVGVLFDRVSANNQGAFNKLSQNVVYLTGSVGVGANGKIIGQYGMAGDVSGLRGSTSGTGARHYVLGYEHSLSKRTIVKAVYSRIANDSNVAYDYAIGSVTNTVGGVGNGSTLNALSVGLRHSF